MICSNLKSLSWIHNKLLMYTSMVDPDFVVRMGGRSKTVSIQVAYRDDPFLTITDELKIQNHHLPHLKDDLESIQKMIAYTKDLVNQRKECLS
jgi:hypothetical protein